VSSSLPTEPDVAALGAALRALAEGVLAGWKPLPDTATMAHLRVVAPEGEAGSAGEWLLGQPATTWRLPPTAAAPFGVIVWLQADHVTLVEVREPNLLSDPRTSLGPPDAVLPSGLGPVQEQWLWPRHGLLLHVDRVTGRVTRLYGHQASTIDEMVASPLAKVRLERHVRRDN
jgi:hypothetical protein